MKKVFCGVVLLGAVIYLFTCKAEMIVGTIFKETEPHPGHISRSPLHFAEDKMDYVDGGITFTYPTDHFSEAPMVTISLETKDMAFTSSIACASLITTNSSTETSVQVHRISDVVEEAATDEVTVYLSAVGSP